MACSQRISFARRIAARDPTLRLYAILDAGSCARRGLDLADTAGAWRDAGIRLLQYRDKAASDAEVLRNAARIRSCFRTDDSILLLNDRVHLLRQSGWDGVHIGQTDSSLVHARNQVGVDAIVGLSTHTPAQAEAASSEDVDYVAAGPLYATSTKADAEPVIGLCTLQAIRALIRKPLIAIGGITATTSAQVIATGADSVAVISALLPPANASYEAILQTAQDFLAAFE